MSQNGKETKIHDINNKTRERVSKFKQIISYKTQKLLTFVLKNRKSNKQLDRPEMEEAKIPTFLHWKASLVNLRKTTEREELLPLQTAGRWGTQNKAI